MLKGNILHFINRIDDTNCGDRIVCPLIHYIDYFKQYAVKSHDIRNTEFEASALPTWVLSEEVAC